MFLWNLLHRGGGPSTHFLSGQERLVSSPDFLWHQQASSMRKPSAGLKPEFLRPITGCTVEHGGVARFHACLSASLKPEITWFHNQQPIQPTKNVVFHFDELTNVATLIIVDAFSEHAGQYACRAANSAGEAVCSATLTITKEGITWMGPGAGVTQEDILEEE
uniref:Ig-like domain-containing protein n=1 Tax=Nothobranchius furzeri TaxID=105023 RepID=A0A8C6L5D2_NOTFU